MDKDRIAGAAKEIKGSVKETIGRAVGDAKLQSDGKADMAWPSRRLSTRGPPIGGLVCAAPRRPVNKHCRRSPTIEPGGVV